MKPRSTRRILFPAMLALALLLPCGCLEYFSAEREVFTSPGGTNTIILRYDFVCRPTVYKKGLLWDKKIWDYPGSGFMETVHFGVEWLSENEFRLSYDDVNHDEYDEEYIITVPG